MQCCNSFKMDLYTIENFLERIFLNNISLSDALADHTTACGWCVRQCSDEDKYEMLVTCIRIQIKFNEISKTINLVLDKNAPIFFDKIIEHSGKIAEEIKDYSEEGKNKTSDFDEERKLPGCSQIFNIAQSIAQTHISKFRNND